MHDTKDMGMGRAFPRYSYSVHLLVFWPVRLVWSCRYHIQICSLWLFSRGRGARLLDEVEAEPRVSRVCICRGFHVVRVHVNVEGFHKT